MRMIDQTSLSLLWQSDPKMKKEWPFNPKHIETDKAEAQYALFTLYMPLTSSRTEIKRPPQQHTNKISKLKYFNFREENRDTRFRKVIRFPNIFRIFYN